MAKKRLLKIAELFDLSSAIKKQLNDDYAYENMTIEIILTDKELRMLDEELFFRNNPTAKKSEFIHADIVTAIINNIKYIFKTGFYGLVELRITFCLFHPVLFIIISIIQSLLDFATIPLKKTFLHFAFLVLTSNSLYKRIVSS